jgi:hypothetical protein
VVADVTELRYYRVVLMPGRRWAVVHRVPGTTDDAEEDDEQGYAA